MIWTEDEEGDLAFADGLELELEPVRVELPPQGKVIRRGGRYEIEDPQRIPSLVELIRFLDELGVDFTDPLLAGAVPEDELVTFCLAQGINVRETLRLARKQVPYDVFLKRGHLQELALQLRMYEEGDAILSEVGVPLPVAELHAPWIEGCEASYETSSAESGSAALLLSIRGTGAGGGITTKIKFQDRVWTAAACGQVVLPGDIQVVPWHNPDQDRTIEVVSISNLSVGEWSLIEIPDDRVHRCSDRYEEQMAQLTGGEERRWRRPGSDYFRLEVEVPGGIARRRALESTREFHLALGGIVDVRSQFTSEYTYAYTIREKAEYVGFFEDPSSETFFWAWNQHRE